ncbi:MAG TPA: NUDIX domain-containing protein [Alphaproteobacteria bacterium]|nr:NUDIX domain-containing protein [Alphaproteobacteria bacterium]
MTARSNNPSPVVPVPAATLLLLRDGEAGLELLMTVRHGAIAFGSGAMVFPGGKVDAADRALIGCCAKEGTLGEAALIPRIAAIRETFEECGILLARAPGSAELLSEAAVAALRGRHGSGTSFATLVKEAGLELASDLLVPFAHWITPRTGPKRYDTLFFMAEASADQVASHDGREAVEVAWTTPQQAMEDADGGRRKLMFATYVNLLKLASYASAADALAAARRRRIVTVVPELVDAPEGPEFRIPAEADYGITHLPARKVRRP